MKITITRKNTKNRQTLRTVDIVKWMGQIAHDDAQQTVGKFREEVADSISDYDFHHAIPTWRHVFPTAEFTKDTNGNLMMTRNNGILMLYFDDIVGEKSLEKAKTNAAFLPSTYLVVTAADAKGIVVLVRYADENGMLPADEEVAKHLYRQAAARIRPLYLSQIEGKVAKGVSSLYDNFLDTLDAHPYYNPQAIPLRVNRYGVDRQSDMLDMPSPVKVDDATENPLSEIKRMIAYFDSHYDFRYNDLMKYTEYLNRQKAYYDFQPLDERVKKRMAIELHLAGINVSYKDVRNYLESDIIRQYNPMDHYLYRLHGKWDGQDHIGALARTVPTANPHWDTWFRIWFLAMVNQWRGQYNRRYGNSMVPLLISPQGYHKSTFCRSLLPPELQWGYNDNLLLNEKRQVLQAMSQFLLINLDEFNQISPKVQQGFLKNLIQLSNIKIKRAYGTHVEEFPRLASFIATSNMDDILADPSGNRRFMAIELTAPIRVDCRPNHEQLYAQAVEAIENGEKTWFDEEQTKLVMENNERFTTIIPVEQCFAECFSPAANEMEGEYLSVAKIYAELKTRFGSGLSVANIQTLGRHLKQIAGLERRVTRYGTDYLVKRLGAS